MGKTKRKKIDWTKIVIIILVMMIMLAVINWGIFIYVTYVSPNDSLIVKIKPLRQAYVFAHGSYISEYLDKDESIEVYRHYTVIDGENRYTLALLNELRMEGYQHIWISMCEQGNSEYIVYVIEDDEEIGFEEWGDDIDRVTKEGEVYPIFYGLGFYRYVK